MAKPIDQLYEAVAILNAIRQALDVPRNRFGKLEETVESGAALRKLAIKYNVGGAEDAPDETVRASRRSLLNSKIPFWRTSFIAFEGCKAEHHL